MSTKEPAWKAELYKAIADAIEGDAEQRPEDRVGIVIAVGESMIGLIQAAEERGRRGAQARLVGLQELHENNQWHCGTCADEYGAAAPWPCPTARALDPESS